MYPPAPSTTAITSLSAVSKRPCGTSSATRAERCTRGPSGTGWITSAGPAPGFTVDAPVDCAAAPVWAGAAGATSADRELVEDVDAPIPQAAVSRLSAPRTIRTLCTFMAYATPGPTA